MIVSDSQGNFERKVCPAGNFPARCVQMLDLGTQKVEFKGVAKEQRKVRLTWEFPTELEIFKEEKGLEPFVLSKEFTASLNEKGNLRPLLENWRGKKFTEEELKGFDLKNIVGKTCLVNVIHEEKDGNTYAKISGVTSLPKGMEVPEQINPTIIFELDEFDLEVYEGLHDFIKDKIKASKEFKENYGEESGL